MMSSDPLSSDLFSFSEISLDDDALPQTPSATTTTTTTNAAVTAPSNMTSTVSHGETPRFLRWMIHVGLLDQSPSSWETSFLNMQSTFERYVREHPYPAGEEETTTETPAQSVMEQTAPDSSLTDASKSTDLDPLTAMVQATESEEKRLAELDLQYRKEKAMRNRGKAAARLLPESEEYDEEFATLQVIDKDLNRLANPHANEIMTSKEAEEDARKEMLRQVLFCYHCCNPEPGYRQGMHEIASYLLYALELDQSGRVNSVYQACLTYHLLAQILQGMAPAFDVHSGGAGSGNGGALQTIGRRVDHMVRTHDALLGQRLANLQVPGQMYFTKWIRLLFAREVNSVLEFWDEAFFTTQHTSSPSPQLGNGNKDFMPLLEALTAGRLLVWSAHFMSIRDDGQILQTLMNLPVEPETTIWCQVARTLLKKGQAIVIPPANQQFRPPLPPPEPTAPPTPPPQTSHLPSLAVKPSIVPFKNFLAETGTGKHLGGWMEQISSKTQILGQRVKQEWEHIAAAAHPEQNQNMIYQQYPSTPHAPKDAAIGYNIAYRGSPGEPPLYDPPVPTSAATAPQPNNVSAPPRPLTRNAICKRLDQSTATLHGYLLEQQQSFMQVPPGVWEALADLQKLSQDLRPRVNQK